jgi:hypothetical protein
MKKRSFLANNLIRVIARRGCVESQQWVDCVKVPGGRRKCSSMNHSPLGTLHSAIPPVSHRRITESWRPPSSSPIARRRQAPQRVRSPAMDDTTPPDGQRDGAGTNPAPSSGTGSNRTRTMGQTWCGQIPILRQSRTTSQNHLAVANAKVGIRSSIKHNPNTHARALGET